MEDFADLSTNVKDLRRFIKINKKVSEVVADIVHKMEIYSRHEIVSYVFFGSSRILESVSPHPFAIFLRIMQYISTRVVPIDYA